MGVGTIPPMNEQEYRDLGARLTQRVNASPLGTGDLIVRVTTDPTIAAPAWFLHFEGIVFLDHAVLDVRNEPLVIGALMHELGHANHTTWTIPPGTHPRVAQVALWMEEIRVERWVNDTLHSPGDLRALFSWLSERLRSQPTDSEFSLSGIWALGVGRYFSGVCSWSEVQDLDQIVRTELTDQRVDRMNEILSEAVTAHVVAGHPQPLLDLASTWVDLFDYDDDDEVWTLVIPCHESGPSEVADATTEEAEVLDDALLELGRVTAEPAEEAPSLHEPVKAMRQAVIRGDRARGFNGVAPSPAIRFRAASLSRVLGEMHLPSVAAIRSLSTLPPGRLQGREMLRLAADRSAGRMSYATPWKTTKRSRTVHKPVQIGTMTDTSGSMSWAKTLVAEFAWVAATAGYSIGARTAAITFGDRVMPVVLPGQFPRRIHVHPANGSVEVFDEAAAVLDALLHLSYRDRSAKVVFIVSDGVLVIEDESKRARLWLQRWTRAGAQVFWLGCIPERVPLYEMPGVTFINGARSLGAMLTQLEAALKAA